MPNPQPPKKLVPFPLTGKQVITPAKQSIPEELQKLDGQPLAAVMPENNVIESKDAKVVRGQETANSVEFNLHEDGTLVKYIERPGYAPQCLLVDGAGRQFGVVRNAEVADMISNAVNAMHLAVVMQRAEEQAKRAEENPGGPPPALLLPPTTT